MNIPCKSSGDSRWTQRSQMSGRDYLLTFDWNQRLGQWFLRLCDQDDRIIRAVGLNTDWPLLRGCVDPRRPPGTLLLLDTSSRAQDCSFVGLGDRWALIYLSPEELAAL